MIIHQPEIISAHGEAILQARIETNTPNTGLPETLWFTYPEHWAGAISTRSDSFLSALLLVAMTLGEDIECRGELSPRLCYNLAEYQKIFTYWQPKTFHPVQIRSDKILPAPISQSKPCYATTFSGGVDSFFTLHELLNPTPEKPNWPIKYALFMQGSADIPLSFTQKYQKLVKQYSMVTQNLGIELIPVRTNLMYFCDNRIALRSFLEAPLSGAAIGLGPMITGIFMPTGGLYKCYTDYTVGPITTHLLCTENFESYSHGSTNTRFEKTLAISNWTPAQKNLRVCSGWLDSETENCSQCEKCLRTRMILHSIGKLEKFSTLKPVFSFRETLRWGRWLELGFDWENESLKYAWSHKKKLVPGILLGILIGYLRHYLKLLLPEWIKQEIFKWTAEKDPHLIFDSAVENPREVKR
ncbi:MAG: hypothetical protein K8R77_16650 [Anaerolineaceae bacterium]|nr:hypothetical protein [Anaerolineaceae bacterium]